MTAREHVVQRVSELQDARADLMRQVDDISVRLAEVQDILALLPQDAQRTTQDEEAFWTNPAVVREIQAALQNGPASQKDLSENSGFSSSTISRNIRAMAAEGLIQRIGTDNRSPVWALNGAPAVELEVEPPVVAKPKAKAKPKKARRAARGTIRARDKQIVLDTLRQNGGKAFQADFPIERTSSRYYALHELEKEGLVRLTGEVRQGTTGPPTKEWQLVEASTTQEPAAEEQLSDMPTGVRRAIVIEPGVGVSEGRQVG